MFTINIPASIISNINSNQGWLMFFLKLHVMEFLFWVEHTWTTAYHHLRLERSLYYLESIWKSSKSFNIPLVSNRIIDRSRSGLTLGGFCTQTDTRTPYCWKYKDFIDSISEFLVKTKNAQYYWAFWLVPPRGLEPLFEPWEGSVLGR